MKLEVGSEKIMLVFILGLLFFTVIQPTFYPSYSTTPPSTTPSPTPPPGRPTPTPPAGGPTATPTPPAGGQNPAFFTINPSTTTVRQGETFTLSLTLNSGDYEIDAVDLILNFDSQFLRADLIEPGTIFSQYPAQEIEDGKVTVKAAGQIVGGTVVGFKGEGEYVRINFQALQTVDLTQISFDNNCLAASAGVDRLDLARCQPGNYQIE